MEDRDFLDLIYTQWARTTGAEDRYWMPEESDDFPGLWDLLAVNEAQERKPLAAFLSNEDADFITAIHGCLPDLIRLVRSSLDEADRLDEEKDRLEGRVAELEIEADKQTAEVDRLNALVLSYTDLMKEQDSFVEFLTNEVNEMERWADNGGPGPVG